MMALEDIPSLNAVLNFFSTLCLIFGFISIKKNRVNLHRAFMVSALLFSSLFLAFYLYYHFHVGSKIFPALGIIKTIYLIILIPHTILATLMVPFIFATFYFAIRKKFDRHKKLAKFILPVWLFVSVTGIIIYLMLYRWYA